jgi:hypothetical protein
VAKAWYGEEGRPEAGTDVTTLVRDAIKDRCGLN